MTDTLRAHEPPQPRVRVAPDELTCTGCGETTTGRVCTRCAKTDTGGVIESPAPLVPTVSYLQDGEWEGV